MLVSMNRASTSPLRWRLALPLLSLLLSGCSSLPSGLFSRTPPTIKNTIPRPVLTADNLKNATHATLSPRPTPALTAPDQIDIRLLIEDSVVISARLVDQSSVAAALGRLYYSGRFLYRGQLAFRFNSSRLGDAAYYLAIVPSQLSGDSHADNQVDGQFLVTAYKAYREQHQPERDPPRNFLYQIHLEQGVIRDEQVVDPQPWWGRFQFEGIDRDRRLLLMSNPFYPQRLWSGSFEGTAPEGYYQIMMELEESNSP